MENNNIRIKTKNDILLGVLMSDKHDDDKRYKKNTILRKKNRVQVEKTQVQK